MKLIKEKVLKVVGNFYDEVCEDLSLSLKDDMGFDSISVVSLLLELEEQFDIAFDESEMDPSELNTVNDLIKLVEKYESKD